MIVAIEILGGNRNLIIMYTFKIACWALIFINSQQAILNAYIINNSRVYKIYSANVSLLHRNIIRAM